MLVIKKDIAKLSTWKGLHNQMEADLNYLSPRLGQFENQLPIVLKVFIGTAWI